MVSCLMELIRKWLNFTCLHCVTGLKFLVRICTDLGLKDAQDYANKLKRAEKQAKMREEVRMMLVFFIS